MNSFNKDTAASYLYARTPPKKLDIVIIRMADASYNKGEEALLSVVISVLRPVARTITVCDDRPDLVQRRHGVKAVSASHSKVGAIAKTMLKSDLIVWGGGHMAQDISSYWSILGRLWLPMLAKALKRRVFIFAVDIGPLRTQFGRWLSGRFFGQHLSADDILVVRNSESVELLKTIGVPSERIRQVPDAAFSCRLYNSSGATQALRDAGVSGTRPLIGLCPRATFYMKSSFIPASLRFRLLRSRGGINKRTEAYKRSLSRTLDLLIDGLDVDVILIPMDIAPNPRDDLLCRDIAELTQQKKRVFVLGHQLDLAETFGLIGQMDLLISGRFHGCVFSIVTSTPLVPMNTRQEKIPRLMRMFEYRRPLLSIDDIADDPSGRLLYNEVLAIWGEAGTEKERSRRILVQLRNHWDQTIPQIMEALQYRNNQR